MGSDAHDQRRCEILRRYDSFPYAYMQKVQNDNVTRRLFPSTTVISEFLSTQTSQDAFRDFNLSSKQSVCLFHDVISREERTLTKPVYPSGDVCISILHPPEDDKYGYESAAERWSPVQTPETILLSVISMLSDLNDQSPANIEAGRLWRDDPAEFKKKVRKCVRESQENAW